MCGDGGRRPGCIAVETHVWPRAPVHASAASGDTGSSPPSTFPVRCVNPTWTAYPLAPSPRATADRCRTRRRIDGQRLNCAKFVRVLSHCAITTASLRNKAVFFTASRNRYVNAPDPKQHGVCVTIGFNDRKLSTSSRLDQRHLFNK